MLSLNSRRKYSTGGEFACKSMFRPVRSLKSKMMVVGYQLPLQVARHDWV